MDIIPQAPKEIKRVAAYVRVSTQEQRDHGISIDDQVDSLTAWVQDHGYQLAGIYNDAGISARSRYTKRPAMLRMLDDCKAGKIDLIVATKLDRFFRNVRSFYEVQTILDDCKVSWLTTREDYETETAAGRLKLNIMLSVAQDEADRTSERIKAVFDRKRIKGECLGGSAPIGYRWASKGVLEIDPEEEQTVRLIFDTYLATFSYQAVMDELQAIGRTDLTYPRIRWMMAAESYCGLYRYGECPKYISREQHDLIIKKRSQRSRKPVNNHLYMYAGICKCGKCGANMVGTADPYGKSRYRCSSISQGKSCGMRSLAETEIEAALIAQIDDAMSKTSPIQPKQKTRQKSTKALENKLERLKDLYIDGDISRERYDAQKQAITEQINAIRNESETAPRPAPALPDDWKAEYKQLTPENKKAFWQAITDHIEVGNNITGFWY